MVGSGAEMADWDSHHGWGGGAGAPSTAPGCCTRAEGVPGSAHLSPLPPLPGPPAAPGSAASPPASPGSGHSSSSGVARRASLHSWTPSRWSLSGALAGREAVPGPHLRRAPCPQALAWSALGGGSRPTSHPAPPPSPGRQRNPQRTAGGWEAGWPFHGGLVAPWVTSPQPTSKISSLLSSLVLKTRPWA